MEYENAMGELDLLFERNPAYGPVFTAAIDACKTRISEAIAAALIESAKTAPNQTQSGAALVATLVNCGGLNRIITVNGEEYAGTMEEMQNDETLPDNITVEYFVESTPAGFDAVAAYEDSISLKTLFAERPQYVPGYTMVLTLCAEPEGKTTNQLQEALLAAGVLKPGVLGQQELHTSYFTSKLETSGALVWDRTCWRTTPKGLAALNA